jgi:hypothetical protein
MNNDKFLGHNGFLWFVGVVEDRQDPQYTGRVRVRCLGHHTSNTTILPTSDLPWAQVVLPITSSGISGLGQSPLGLVEGSWVFGYFRDGSNRQEPLVIGSLPGKPSELSQAGGFYDPNGIYPKYRNEPSIPYNASYPYNHVYESESGHIREYDDTPGYQRIYESHRTGTSYEIDASGNRTDIIKGIHYTLVSDSNKHFIQGDSDITIDGRHKIYINKNNTPNNHYDIQVGAGASINIQVDDGDVNVHTVTGKINMNSGGDYNLKVGGNMNVVVEGNTTETIEGTKTSNTTGAVIHRGSTIDLNP